MFKGDPSKERVHASSNIRPSIRKVTEYNAFDAYDPLEHAV